MDGESQPFLLRSFLDLLETAVTVINTVLSTQYSAQEPRTKN
jgi:hypothetical protein